MSSLQSPDPARPVDREELFQLLVESATDFAIITTDPTGNVTSWNIGAERLIGYSEAEIVGRSADVIFVPEDRRLGAPETERADALRHGRAEDERWHLRKDGSLFWGSGLMMPLRGSEGFVKIMRDRTESRLAEERLAESEERFRTLAINIPALAFRTRRTGERTWGSPQWEVYSGLSHERSLGFGWLDAIHPDDRDATLAAWQQAAETGSYEIEHRIRRQSDGAYRWHQTRASAYATENGQEVELVGTSTDIHELRSLQNRQQVLLAELQHRTRNLLALVQAMARKTLRSAESLDAFANEFEGRLTALSRVQGLVASTTKGMLDLRPLLEAELKARGEWPSNKIRIDGPDIEIPTRTAQTLALALHELATNALKYGAIGQPSGRLDVTWRVEAADGQCPRIILEWTESGVSMPDVPSTRRGYGRELIERALPHQLSAETTMEFGSDGVRCVIVVPVAPEPDDKANIPQFNLASGST